MLMARRYGGKAEGRRQKAELDHGSHGLTRTKGLSHPQPSVSSVVRFCGIRIAECGLRNPPNAEYGATDETRIKHGWIGMGTRRTRPSGPADGLDWGGRASSRDPIVRNPQRPKRS